ncbi:MAG: hydrogenase iron-sulfur subunit [Bacillota bacterium]
MSVPAQKTASDFEPKIIALLCNWCTYTGADLAGTSRIQYPPNIRVIRVMCSGSVDPLYIIKPILEGADGVLVGGCHAGDCHYVNGNYKARRRVAIAKNVLSQFGIPGDRVWFRFISASEGKLFADTVTKMVATLKQLGPNPMKAQWEI